MTSRRRRGAALRQLRSDLDRHVLSIGVLRVGRGEALRDRGAGLVRGASTRSVALRVIDNVGAATIATEPKSTVELKGHEAERLLKLLDALDDQDDVDEVFANFDIPEHVLEQLAA